MQHNSLFYIFEIIEHNRTKGGNSFDCVVNCYQNVSLKSLNTTNQA